MGLFITLTELLGRLTVLTPLLERYLGSGRGGAHALDHVQQSVATLSTAQSELSTSLESSLKEQQIRLARLEELAARVANRLAELVTDREKLEADVRKLQAMVRLILVLCLVSLVALLGAIAVMLLRAR